MQAVRCLSAQTIFSASHTITTRSLDHFFQHTWTSMQVLTQDGACTGAFRSLVFMISRLDLIFKLLSLTWLEIKSSWSRLVASEKQVRSSSLKNQAYIRNRCLIRNAFSYKQNTCLAALNRHACMLKQHGACTGAFRRLVFETKVLCRFLCVRVRAHIMAKLSALRTNRKSPVVSVIKHQARRWKPSVKYKLYHWAMPFN